MVNEQYDRAKRILSEHKEGHNELTQLLIDKEVIFAEDVERIFGKRPWASRSEEIMAAKESQDAARAERELAQKLKEEEKEIKEAEGRAEAIRAVQQATADGLRAIKEAGADDSVIRLKALEAFEKAANGQATKIIVPSDIAGMAGLAKGIVESVKEDQ